MEAEATPITLEDDWLKQLLGPETTAFATTATEVASVPAQTFVAAAVPVQKRRQKSGQAYVTPPALRKENAIKAGKGRATVIAVKVDPNELSDTEEAAPPAPPAPAPVAGKKEKRSRKSAASATTASGYASSGESPPVRPRLSGGARGSAPSSRRSSGSDDLLVDIEAMITNNHFSELSILSPTPSATNTPAPSQEAAAEADAAADGDAAPIDNGRKVRHNLTERRRVDRMNQLFNKLYTAIEEAAPATDAVDKATGQPVLGVLGADGKPINPSRWSKADVLEGALNVISDLRQQLSEERLARTLGVPPPSAEGGDGIADSYANSVAGSESYAESDQFSDSSALSGAHFMLLSDAIPAMGATISDAPID